MIASDFVYQQLTECIAKLREESRRLVANPSGSDADILKICAIEDAREKVFRIALEHRPSVPEGFAK